MTSDAPPWRLAFVAAIGAARERSGCGPKEFARRLGVKPGYYEDVERGDYNISLRTIMRIADGLNCTVTALAREAQI